MRFYRENVSKLAMGLIEMYLIPGAFFPNMDGG